MLVRGEVPHPHALLAEEPFGLGGGVDLPGLLGGVGERFLAQNVLARGDGHQHVRVVVGRLGPDVCRAAAPLSALKSSRNSRARARTDDVDIGVSDKGFV